MTPTQIHELIQQGEGLTLEFKQAQTRLNRDVYESICAFLNRSGGTLLLGVKDNGDITGIEPAYLPQLKRDLVTTLHNTLKLNPPVYLVPQEIEISGKVLLALQVPQSSQVHFCNGRIFDRNEEGDLDITAHTALVSQLYLRKQVTYSENRIYPYVTLADLRLDLIARVRKQVKLARRDHSWAELEDLDLLKNARLWQKDFSTGQEGFSLACVLLFGKDETLLSILPHHRTDALLRLHHPDRYDDRDDIRTNLIESYERLMAFVSKHVADPFYLEGDKRVSLREQIFREVVANMLIHREYLNPFPARLTLFRDYALTENSNNPHHAGIIDPTRYFPTPKNPVIARVFKEMQWAEELGSGVKQLFKYGKTFGGADPILKEDSVFQVRLAIPILALASETAQVTAQVTAQAERWQQVVDFCEIPRTRAEIQVFLGLKHREHVRRDILQPLLAQGRLQLTLPDTPHSPRQRYVAVSVG